MDIENIVVYKGAGYHSAFPDIIRLQNSDLVAVFRQTPVRAGSGVHGELNAKVTHFHEDPDSRIALVRSVDDGKTWAAGSLVVVDPPDGVKDRNLAAISQLASGELVVNSMRMFANLTEEELKALSRERHLPPARPDRPFNLMMFDSLYLTRSHDDGHTWGQPEPFGIESLTYSSHTGKSGLVEMPGGEWLLALHGHAAGDVSGRVYVARSYDGGRSWVQPSTVAYDPDGRINFAEPPLLRLSSGKLLTLMRTSVGEGYLYQAHSNDDGWVWQGLKRTPIWGFPCQLVQLSSERVLCTYGYRRKPFGIRAALSDDEGETWNVEREIILRDDGMHRDLGYPSSVQLRDGRILSTYYFHGEDGIRYIGGSIWSEKDALN